MSEPSGEPSQDGKRRERRVRVRLPVAVRGVDRSGVRFDEHTVSENVCRGGLAFVLSREIDLGVDWRSAFRCLTKARKGTGTSPRRVACVISGRVPTAA